MNALELADIFDKDGDGCTCNAYVSFECACGAEWADGYFREASTELRRLHEQNKQLLEEIEALKQKPVECPHGSDKNCKECYAQQKRPVKTYAGGKPNYVIEPECSTHPDAPHGFDRNGSHNAGRYVCTCEGWRPDVEGYPV